MEKLIIHTLPNWIDIPLKILLVIIVISFPTFIFAAAKNKFKLYVVSHLILIISMSLSFVIASIIAIIGVIPDNNKSYTIKNSTYNIIVHKNNIYYLENSEKKDKVIKIPDKEFEGITNQK